MAEPHVIIARRPIISADGTKFAGDIVAVPLEEIVEGLEGEAGPQGPQGIQGPEGDRGPRGIQGEKGDTGTQGPTGATGATGAKGDEGDPGPRGLRGYTGATGAAGPKGPKGDVGDTGPQGSVGPTGPAGPFSAPMTLENPDGVDVGARMIWVAPFACTVTGVRGHRKGGSGATINARRNQGATRHLAAPLSLTSANTWMTDGAVQDTAYATGDDLELEVVSVAGIVTELAVQVDFIRA